MLNYLKQRKGVAEMVLIPVVCPHCKSESVKKFGTSPIGKQRYACKVCNKTFQLDYTYTA